MATSPLHILCSSFKASTHSVVLAFDIATGHCWPCSYFYLFIIECVLIWSVYMCILLIGCTYHIPIMNLKLQYKGAPKYLGESVTGSKFGLWKT